MLDFGGPVLLTPFELRRVGEAALHLPPGSLSWTGPFDPDADEDWRVFQSGGMTERQYWDRRVAEFHDLTGLEADMPTLMGYLYSGSEDELIRPEARALIRDARAAGVPVAILTNDLTAFHDADWVARMTVLGEVDVIVDGRRDGVMKPAPEAYELVLDRLGVPAEGTVFVDDQPINLAGADAVGLTTVHLDPVNPGPGYAEARALLGL